MDSTPVIVKNRGISPVWILPIVALVLCLWIFFKSYQNAGIEITIYFEDASGIIPGKTQVIAKGIPIGIVKEMHAELDQQRIRTVIRMDKETERFLVEDAIFWIVRPQISGTKVLGLDTIVSGSYIGMQAGVSKAQSLVYTGLSSPPPVSEEAPGLHLHLQADALRSIQVGSGIYYRNIQIGSVQSYSLEKNDAIRIKVHIKPKHVHLVREGSRFYNASGITLSGKLTNMKLHIESLATLIIGGIVIYTPEEQVKSRQIENGHSFSLYSSKELAELAEGVKLTVLFDDIKDLSVGAPVKYKGVPIGKVSGISFADNLKTIVATLHIKNHFSTFFRKTTKIWLAVPKFKLSEVKNPETLISGPYITFLPGKGKRIRNFSAEKNPPQPRSTPTAGLNLQLVSTNLGSVDVGSPVYFRQVRVGMVTGFSLSKTFQEVIINVNITDPYVSIVQDTTRFWKVSGTKIEGGIFSGIKVSTESLETLIAGGIAFFTFEPGKQVKENQKIKLHKEFKESWFEEKDTEEEENEEGDELRELR